MARVSSSGTLPFDDPAVQLAHRTAIRSIERVVAEVVPPTEPAAALRRVAELFAGGGVLVITGAGVSTDSGIPDYRGPRGSLTRHRPMTFQEFRHHPAAARRYWARSYVGWRVMTAAAPNRTHFALAELEGAGLVDHLVTQNVDGLHLAAGSRRVTPLHGDLAQVICLDCGRGEDRRELDRRFAAANPGFLERVSLDPAAVNPDGDVVLPETMVEEFHMVGCLACGSKRLKPDVVYFGESVPAVRKQAAADAAARARAVVTVGTSLAVMSRYRLVLDAARRGVPIAVVNGGPSRADAKAEVVWRTGVAPAFDAVLDALEL